MDNKLKAIFGMLQGKIDPKLYLDTYLFANDGHYDEWSSYHYISTLSLDLETFGLTPAIAGTLVDAKKKELNLTFTSSEWDAYAFISRALKIHSSSTQGELDKAVTLATETMAEKFIS